MTCKFKVNFKFEDDAPLVDTNVHIIRNNIFTPEDLTIPTPLYSVPRSFEIVQEVLECYNVVGED